MTDSPKDKIKYDLIKSQYDLLRDAIKNSRERMHQLSLAGVISFPAGVLIAGSKISDTPNLGTSAIFILSPILILAFGMLYRSERAALKKYGHYINDYIDPWMDAAKDPPQNFLTWEQFRRGKFKSEKPAHPSEYEHTRNLSLELLIGTYIVAGCALSSHQIAYGLFPVSDKDTSAIYWRLFFLAAFFASEIRIAAYIWSEPKSASDIISAIISKIYISDKKHP